MDGTADENASRAMTTAPKDAQTTDKVVADGGTAGAIAPTRAHETGQRTTDTEVTRVQSTDA